MPITINDCECGQTPVVWSDEDSGFFAIRCPQADCKHDQFFAVTSPTFLRAVKEWNEVNKDVDGAIKTVEGK